MVLDLSYDNSFGTRKRQRPIRAVTYNHNRKEEFILSEWYPLDMWVNAL
jgi:hypothetical protein